MLYDQDADLSLLDDKTVAVIGHGSQGHAHALNLRDSGVTVVVGLRPDSASRTEAEAAGLDVRPVAEAAAAAEVVMLLVPDEAHRDVWESQLRDVMGAGKTLLVAHGFSVHYGEIEPTPEIDVALVAPKGPGHLVRREYVGGGGVPGLIAVAQDVSGGARELALAYAKGIGCTRGGVFETSFREEAESDLFGEQAVICGGVTELVRNGFETLVAAGYDEQMAYFECVHELKLIVDLIYEKGLPGMRDSISDTAEYGDYSRGPRIIGASSREEMGKVLEEIRSGEFAREWIAENRAGRENFERMRAERADDRLERVGSQLREGMPWLRAEQGR